MDGNIQDQVIGSVVDLIPTLRGYARALTRNVQDADDLVQETLIKALARIDSFEPGTRLRSWLFTIMRNTFYNNVQRRARETTGTADCISGDASADATQETTVRCRQVLAAIDQLPDQFREMLVLVVMFGETYQDAAQICGCAVGTVKSRVNRARQMVIETLGADA